MFAITPVRKTMPGITPLVAHTPKFRQEGIQPAPAHFGLTTLSFGQKAPGVHRAKFMTPTLHPYQPVGTRLDYYA